MKGINKLKMVLAIIIIIDIIAIGFGMLYNDLSDKASKEFMNKLNPTELNQLAAISSKYPDALPSDNALRFAGWLGWMELAMIGVLLYKVCKTQKIE